MDKHAWSLVAFTLLAQAGAGTYLIHECLLLAQPSLGGDDPAQLSRKIHLLVLGILAMALLLSFFHLGYPLHSFHALNNLGHSWLSREILGMILLGTFLLLINLRDHFPGFLPYLKPWLTGGAMVSALFLLLSMSRLYMLETVPLWDNWHTPVSFAITALLAGTGILLFSGQGAGYGSQLSGILIWAGVILSLLSLGNHFMWTGLVSQQLLLFNLIRAGCGILAAAFFLAVRPSLGQVWESATPTLLAGFALACSLAGECLTRLSFFQHYARVGV